MVHFVYIVAASQCYSLKPFQDKSRLEPSTQEQPPEGLINGDMKNNWKVGNKETIEHEWVPLLFSNLDQEIWQFFLCTQYVFQTNYHEIGQSSLWVVEQGHDVVSQEDRGHHYSHIQQLEVEDIASNPRRVSEKLAKDINKSYSLMN